MLKEKTSMYVDRAMYGYVILVVLYQLLALAFPTAFVFSVLHLNVISQALAVVGFGLFVADAFTTRRFMDKRYGRPLMLVLATLLVSSLLLPSLGTFGNGQEASIIANAKSIIWQIDQMLVIFPYCASLSRERARKLLRTLFWVVSIVYIPCLLASFWQYIQSLGYNAVYGTSTGTRQGFQGGRLFGLMMGVFSSGLMALVLAFASVAFAIKEKRISLRIVYIAFATIYVLYSVLTATRSLVVGLAVAMFVGSMLFLLRGRMRKGPVYKVLIVLCSLLVSVGAVGIYMGVGSLASLIPQHNAEVSAARAVVAEIRGESEVCALYHPEQETTDATYPIVAVMLDGELMLSYAGGNAPYDRESLSYFFYDYDTEIVRFDSMDSEEAEIVEAQRFDVGESAEVSNGRIAIWTDYANVLLTSWKNVLVGLSPGYYMPTIYDEYEGTNLYIVKNIEDNHPNMIANGLIYDVHNAYLSILVQGGVIACIFVFLFLLRLALDAMKLYVNDRKWHFEVLMLVMTIAFIMAAVFFDSDVFFRTTSTSVVFWVLCGLVAGEVKRSDMPALVKVTAVRQFVDFWFSDLPFGRKKSDESSK